MTNDGIERQTRHELVVIRSPTYRFQRRRITDYSLRSGIVSDRAGIKAMTQNTMTMRATAMCALGPLEPQH